MNGVRDVVDGSTEAHGQRDFVNEIAGMGAQDVSTEYLSLLVCKDFHQSIIGFHGQGLTIGTIEGFVDLVLDACFSQLFLRLSYYGGFGNREDGRGNGGRVKE